MGSPCEIIIRGHDAAQSQTTAVKLEREIQRQEKAYSRFLPDSITTRINRSAGTGRQVVLDEETDSLLAYADTCYQQSGGLFDITSGSLRTLWNYQDLAEKQRPPGQNEVNLALEKIGWNKVEREKGSIRLPLPGMEIDFGGIVKEYAADCVARIAEAEGIYSGMVELGGDIRLFGAESQVDAWQIGIRNPFATDKALALVSLNRGALATSGDYERYTVIGGKKYSHILNPLTGWPVEGFSSVSVLADQCVIAGSAASIAVLMGEEGEPWLKELGLPYLCINSEGHVSGTIKAVDRK